MAKRDSSRSAHAGEPEVKAGSPDASPPAVARTELFLTVFGTGFAVMIVEILGTRIIGPVFGVSLFVWSALLAVTLASLAAGYYVGGVLVDRSPDRRILSLAVVAAGVLVGVIPPLSRVVLALADGLGPRLGALVSATVLFSPSLAVLGMAGPIAIRLATNDLRATGHRVGSVYAISTAGSLIGTLITGFFLVPRLETHHILFATAVLLVLAGAIPLAMRGRRAALGAILVPLIALPSPNPDLPGGIRVTDQAQSLYGLVQVIEDHNRGVRLLRADHSIIGGQSLESRSAVFAFLHVLESVRFMRPKAKDLLQIGLGIGSLPMALKPHGFVSDVVEIDPDVVRFAIKDFGFSTAGAIYTEDARTLLQRLDRKYDVIVHDTFTGGGTPEHLLSLEVIQRTRGLLRPGGILALNFVGYYEGPKAGAAWAIARTMRAVFPNVRAFRDSPLNENPDSIANLVFFASDAPLEFEIPANAQLEDEICADIMRSFRAWEVLKNVPEGPIITDSRNPLARLQLPIAEEHFMSMKELLPPQVWRHF